MALPGLYGGDRIMVGARFLSHLDPGWWREGALLPASPTALDMADPYRCVLAWWAAQHLPAPAQRGTRQVTPYDRAMLALSLSSQQAEAREFTGVDADRLTPGWRHLITYLRASYEGVPPWIRRGHPDGTRHDGRVPGPVMNGDCPGGQRGDVRGLPGIPGCARPGAVRAACRPTGTRRCSASRTGSTSPVCQQAIWDSAAARTTALAPSLPGSSFRRPCAGWSPGCRGWRWPCRPLPSGSSRNGHTQPWRAAYHLDRAVVRTGGSEDAATRSLPILEGGNMFLSKPRMALLSALTAASRGSLLRRI